MDPVAGYPELVEHSRYAISDISGDDGEEVLVAVVVVDGLPWQKFAFPRARHDTDSSFIGPRFHGGSSSIAWILVSLISLVGAITHKFGRYPAASPGKTRKLSR